MQKNPVKITSYIIKKVIKNVENKRRELTIKYEPVLL